LSIGDKPAGVDEHAVEINRRQSVARGERDNQLAMNDRYLGLKCWYSLKTRILLNGEFA
jgi:hypothetical protein